MRTDEEVFIKMLLLHSFGPVKQNFKGNGSRNSN